ncbi:MAG: precorrin-6A reductase [Deltaproteobacteria bacterium]|nr:precorrin-6A reductase [Deltaproteobacteria bacterium]
MILLLGGTAETASLSAALAEAGYEVLVSTATDVSLSVGCHPNIFRRTGPLDVDRMTALVRERRIKAIVDAAHPYASRAHDTARRTAERTNVPCFAFVRPAAVRENDDVLIAAGHQEAARVAVSLGSPILLTIGSRNLLPYVQAACLAGIPLIARVLPHSGSIEACRISGLPEASLLLGRGPFSAEENRAVIRKYGVGVLVTKDSGVEGGVRAKIEAAHTEGCRVVVVRRPDGALRNAFDDIRNLVDRLMATVS